MPTITIHNRTRPFRQPLQATWCESFLTKLLGLMGRPPLREDQALLLVERKPSRSNSAIHMLFMRMDISVIWLDEQRRVVDQRLAKAWRLAYVPRTAACYTLEAHANRLSDFALGDQLEFVDA